MPDKRCCMRIWPMPRIRDAFSENPECMTFRRRLEVSIVSIIFLRSNQQITLLVLKGGNHKLNKSQITSSEEGVFILANAV